mgnify:CR=1 FL=1|tara:strand:+ start:1035 stop:1181 length:147 start_codon:yes stop_codon:yes gene_type:complete
MKLIFQGEASDFNLRFDNYIKIQGSIRGNIKLAHELKIHELSEAVAQI